MGAQKSATLGALSWDWECGKRLGVRARQIAGAGQGALAREGNLSGLGALARCRQGAWLRSVVGGHIRYYGVAMNDAALSTFRFQVGWLWMRTLRRRGQRHHLTWVRMKQHIERWLPPARPCHPYPLKRLGVIT